MKQTRLIDRREFTTEAVLATLAGVVITISGCGGGGAGYSSPSSPTSSPTPTASADDAVGAISDNHGHSAIVTGVQLAAGNSVQVDIRGNADHAHTVTLSAEALRAIKARTAVVTDSTSTTGHFHSVTFNADAPGEPGRY